MKTVTDLMHNEELMWRISEDLEDFNPDAKVTYEVWAMGYDEYDEITDTEFLLKEFDNPDEAVAYAKEVTLADIVALTSDGSEPDEAIALIQVEVETVVDDGEEETMNVGTIYYKTIYNKDAYANIVALARKDYELLEDGSIEVPCKLLECFNKNDYFQAMFTDEDHQPIITYKIISKTTDNKFICEYEY